MHESSNKISRWSSSLVKRALRSIPSWNTEKYSKYSMDHSPHGTSAQPAEPLQRLRMIDPTPAYG